MANTRITPSMSIYNGGATLFQDFAGGSFQIDAGASLITNVGYAAELSGPFTVRVYGTLGSFGPGDIGLSMSPNLAGDRASVSVSSTGTVFGSSVGIYAAEAANITNAGSIQGSIAILEGAAADSTVRNSGRIVAATSGIDFSNTGTHTVINTGVIESVLGYVIRGGASAAAGTENVTNSGRMTGAVSLDDGNDSFINYIGTKHGSVFGTIDLGDGADTFRGGKYAETVIDGGGTDSVRLGSGNDSYIATRTLLPETDGSDTVDGGSGTDTYNASTSATSVFVNLDTNIRNDPYFGATMAARSVNGLQTGTDTVTGFENVIGTSSTDVIFGGSGVNRLEGGVGGDDLWGLGGNDTLIGGDGGDFIIGGTGADRLTGSADGDRFIYRSVSESTVSSTGRDTITDFSKVQGDRIDLSAIDANRLTAIDDSFALVGGGSGYGSFSGTAGEVRIGFGATGTIISGDTNGDKVADFSIALTGYINLGAADFIL